MLNIFKYICLFLFSLTVNANDTVIEKKLEEIKLLDSKNVMNEINIIFKEIDSNKSYNEYKKYLLKEKTIFINEIILMSDDVNKIDNYILPKFFKMVVCLSFQFENNTDNIVNDLVKRVINNDKLKKEKYFEVANFLYSEEVIYAVQDYIFGLGDEILIMCTNPLNFD